MSRFPPRTPPPTGTPRAPANGDYSRVRRVVVAQWGRIYADAIQAICAQAFPHATILSCCSGGDTLAALHDEPADLMFLSLLFPDMDGMDLLRAITEQHLAKRVLLCCNRRDEYCLHNLRNARFDGILDALNESAATTVQALHQVAAGEVYISPRFRETVVDWVEPSDIWLKLTPAEIRILGVIGDGSDNRETAQFLGLSAATIKTHRRNIMHKLHIVTSAKLVREAIRLGMVLITAKGEIIRSDASKSRAEG